MREPTPKEATSDETGATPSVGSTDGPAESAAERKQKSARKLIRDLDGPVDEDFRQSMAGLSQRLADRVAGQSGVDPKEAVAARKAALLAYDVERANRLRATLRIAGAGALSIAIAAAVVFFASPFDRPSLGPSTFAKPVEVAAVPPVVEPTAAAPRAEVAVPKRPTAVEATAGAPAAAPPVATPPVTAPPVITRATPPAAAPSAPVPVAPVPVAPAPIAPTPAAPAVGQTQAPPSPIVETAASPPDLDAPPLNQNEVREAQTKLRAFGFNPGPIDGVTGTMTQTAVVSYQQSRDLQQTGLLDRELLEQLRHDPAPEVAPPPVQRAARPVRQPRSQDPFRAIGQDFERWLRSL